MQPFNLQEMYLFKNTKLSQFRNCLAYLTTVHDGILYYNGQKGDSSRAVVPWDL